MIILWKRFINYLKVRSAVRQADRLHNKTNAKYYVLSIGHKLRALNRKQVNYLCDKGVLDKRLRKAYYLCQASLYYTGASAPKPQTFKRK